VCVCGVCVWCVCARGGGDGRVCCVHLNVIFAARKRVCTRGKNARNAVKIIDWVLRCSKRHLILLGFLELLGLLELLWLLGLYKRDVMIIRVNN
jgi:hypothetical protein